jgi:hypothetical protein
MKTLSSIKHKKQFVLIRGIRGQAFLDLRFLRKSAAKKEDG